MRWLLLLLGFSIACGSTARQCPISVPASRGPAFLWKVQQDGVVVWLYGTIHGAGLDAVPAPALAAFDASPRLVSELGATNPDPDELREYARITRGKGIDQQLPASDWWDLRDALLGKIEEDDLRRAKPWYAMSLLTTYSSPAPGPSMDEELAERAATRKMPIEALETWREQLAALDATITLADLQEAIHARAAMRCDLARLTAAYQAGDTVTMQALLVIPRTEQRLLAPRNRAWLPAIEQQFAHGGAFVAVGLGHLLGEHGLVALLGRAGYQVERVP